MAPANNHRINGWRICQDYFTPDPLTQAAKMSVWSQYNEVFYDNFAVQVRAENNPDDTEPNDFDHVCDEARYLLSSIFSEQANAPRPPLITAASAAPASRRVFTGTSLTSNGGWMR
jgi:hypothetical protein